MARLSAQTPTINLSFAPEGIGIGSCGELVIEIENPSAAVVDQLAFRLDLPDGAAFVDRALVESDCGGELEFQDGGRSIELTNGEVAASSTCSIQVGVTLLAEGPVVLTTSNLTTSAGTSPSASVTLDIPANAPSLGFSKSFAIPVIQLGGTTTLTYLIQNQSGLPAEEISFVDDLSPGIVVAPVPNIQSSCDPALVTAVAGSQEISLTSGSLQPGETCVISIDVVGVASGNNASISSSITSSFPGGNPEASGFSCAVLEVIDPGDLASLTLTKSFPNGPIAPGAEGILRFTLTNNSRSQTFTDIAFTDDLEAMLPGARAVELPEVGGFAVDANFDGAGTSVLNEGWAFLDSLENENGRNDDYPVDASGNAWNADDFDLATSSVGPWEEGDAPFQGGDIAAFPPGIPEQLGGIGAGPNGENLVTTYLFRQTFTLTAEETEIAEWLMVSLFDDAAIVYLNGEEIFRSAEMPAGPVTPNTLSGLGDESAELSTLLNLAGRLREGDNTMAVEVHQNTLTSSDVGFSLALVPADQDEAQGFVYQDDVFEGTNDPNFSEGTYQAEEGFNGGALRVITGGKGFFSFLNPPSSGGWRRTFTIDEPGIYPVSFRYRLFFSGEYEGDEFGQALFELDGVRYGDGPSGSLSQFTGGVGFDQDTGWRFFTTEIFLAAGQHNILLGAYNNRSTQATELTTSWFDELQVGTPSGPAPVCGPDSRIVGEQILDFDGGLLVPGESCSFEVGIRVPVEAETGSYLNRTSIVTTRSGEQDLIGLPATALLAVESVPPSFQATFAPSDFVLDRSGILTFTVDNGESFLEATEMSFTATLPEGVVVDGATPVFSSCGGSVVAEPGSRTVTYTGGMVAEGEICVVSLGVLGVEAGDFVLSGVTLSSSLGESVINDAVVTVSPLPQVALAVTNGLLNAGVSNRLTLTIDNSESRIDAGNLQINLPLPEGVVLASPANPITNCIGGAFSAVSGSDTFSYQGGSVPAGAVCTVSVNVVSNEGGDFLLRTDDVLSSVGNIGAAEIGFSATSLVSVGLTIAESDETAVAGSGSRNLTHVVTVTNGGPSRATAVEIVMGQQLPAGVMVDQVIPAIGTFADNQWSIPELGAGQSTTLTFLLTVGPGALPGEDVISNGASLLSVDQADVDPSDDDALERTSVSNVFDLSLAVGESIDPVLAASGPGNLEYVLTVSNAGPSNATGVDIAALLNLPEGVTVDQAVPTNGIFVDGQDLGGSWTLGVPVGGTESLAVVLSVGATAPDEAVIQFSGNISDANGIDPVAGNNQVSEETTVLAAVDLIVSATGPAEPVVAGSSAGNLVMTFTVRNAGPVAATGIEVAGLFELGDRVELDSLVPSVGAIEKGRWILGSLGVDESATLTATLTVTSSAAVTQADKQGVTGTFTIDSVDQPQINEGDESAAFIAGITREVDLGFALAGSRDPVLAGFELPQNLSHTLTILNNGPSDASGVSVNLDQFFPDGVVIDAVTPEAGTSLAGSVWSVGDLAVGQSVDLVTDFSVPGTVQGGEDLISTLAAVSGANETLIQTGDDQITVATDVASPAGMTVTPVTPVPELDLQTALFKQTITVTNTNPVSLPAFRVLVRNLAGEVSLFNAQGTSEGVPYVVVNQPLATGESLDLTMEFSQLDASGGIQPSFEIELLDTIEEVAGGDGVAVNRCEMLSTGDVLIEFSAVIGESYTIQYSADGLVWTDVNPQVTAGGTIQQWVDNGPPKTASHPRDCKSRLYRVRLLNPGN